MLEQQAKLNHPDLPSGAPSAMTSALASTSAPLGPSNSSMTTTVCEEQPAGTASVVARPAHTNTVIVNARKEPTELRTGSTLNTLVNEPAAKRVRTDVGVQVNVSSQTPPNFVMPSLQTSITGGSPSKVPQQAHTAAHISQHPGPMAQKSFA